jgi:SAM-dependent methyltransferase
MSDCWNESARAWIGEMGEEGDFSRVHVLDEPMLARLRDRPVRSALDVGCGEGRFCRMMQRLGIVTTGIDPTEAFIARAKRLDPRGDYRLGGAEKLDVQSESYDAVVSYLSLIDISDIGSAIPEMVRTLRPGGMLLVANLTSFNTAGMPGGWKRTVDGEPAFCIDNYLEERAVRVSWRGISIVNHHRPLSTYFALFLGCGLELTYFAEPAPTGGDPVVAKRYRRVPYFHIMEWRKPLASERACGRTTP